MFSRLMWLVKGSRTVWFVIYTLTIISLAQSGAVTINKGKIAATIIIALALTGMILVAWGLTNIPREANRISWFVQGMPVEIHPEVTKDKNLSQRLVTSWFTMRAMQFLVTTDYQDVFFNAESADETRITGKAYIDELAFRHHRHQMIAKEIERYKARLQARWNLCADMELLPAKDDLHEFLIHVKVKLGQKRPA